MIEKFYTTMITGVGQYALKEGQVKQKLQKKTRNKGKLKQLVNPEKK